MNINEMLLGQLLKALNLDVDALKADALEKIKQFETAKNNLLDLARSVDARLSRIELALKITQPPILEGKPDDGRAVYSPTVTQSGNGSAHPES